MSISSTSQILHERGLTVDQIILAVRLMESRPDGEDFITSMIEGLEKSKRPEQLADFVERLCPILTREKRPRPDYERAPAPCGPKERWGYEGPITPRLPDKEWWPLRNSVVEDADSTCHYCGDQHDNMCADHVVPLSRGGSNDRDNLVCCCIPCNSSKADRLLSEWRGRYQ